MANISKETFFRCDSYNQAKKQSQGYEDGVLLDSLVANIKRNSPWKDLDKNISYIEHRQLELLCALMRVACENPSKNLNVADVGGGNGYLAMAPKTHLPMINWNWTAFESNSVSDSYIQFQEESGIKWKRANDIEDIYEIGLFSCSLQYMESPFKVLERFALKCKYLIIMRLPLLNSSNHIITKQTFDEGIYQEANASFPAWFFSEDEFISSLEEIGEIMYRWKTPSEVWRFEGEDVTLDGMLVRVSKS
jgi:putative methyltransferase (TIGR04325 family)